MSKTIRNKKKNVLYISYTGMLEPLGESQVLNYLVRLAENHSITLLSFEKPEDLKYQDEVDRIQSICEEHSIKWVRKKYHCSPRLAATFYDMMAMVLEVRKHWKGLQVIHCRGYIPCFASLIIKRLYKLPFIFDMRAFWPDEMVTAGRLKDSGIMYKLLKRLEGICLKKSSHIVVLTEAAKKYLIEQEAVSGINKKISTIPTCVNLDLFHLNPSKAKKKNSEPFILGSVGTVSGWFRIDWLFEFYRAFKEQVPNSVLRFVTRDPESFILENAAKHNIRHEEIEIASSEYRNVPQKMQHMDAAAFFFEPGFSKLGSSPTRMAEFLACGVPCIANSGVGDVKKILTTQNTGIVVDFEEENLEKYVFEMIKLTETPDIEQQCRQTAVEYFSIDRGVDAYSTIYGSI